MSDRVNVTVDGIAVEVEPGTTILQACEEAGVEFRAFAIMSVCRLPAIAACVLSRLKKRPSPSPVVPCRLHRTWWSTPKATA